MNYLYRSLDSLEKKVYFLQEELKLKLKNERAFPLVLYYSYNKVIKPRSDMIRKRQRHFDLEKAMKGTDEEFCKEWGFEI